MRLRRPDDGEADSCQANELSDTGSIQFCLSDDIISAIAAVCHSVPGTVLSLIEHRDTEIQSFKRSCTRRKIFPLAEKHSTFSRVVHSE